MSFSKCYTANVEIKDVNMLIESKGFSDTSIKNKEEAYEKIIEMEKNSGKKTVNLLGCE